MRVVYPILIISFILSSCSAFRSSRKLDITPFSDNSGTLFHEAAKISRPFQWKYLKTYTSIPEFKELNKIAIPLLESMRGIVYYSNQVVAIKNSRLSDKKKNYQLARYLYDAMVIALKNQKVDSLQLGKLGAVEVLENIRKSENYRDAIAAAEPIVNSVVRANLKRIDKIQYQVPNILAGFDREIEREYAATRKNYLQLGELQEQIMRSVTLLYWARMGQTSYLDTLLQNDNSLKKYIPSTNNISMARLAAAEDYLIAQLNRIDIMLNQINDIKMEYLAKQDELLQWHHQLDEKIIIARNAMVVWAQSHRNLGAGIPVPPMIDVAGMATGLVGSATKTIIP